MPDEQIQFATEAEKAKAIETFDESKGSETDLEKIMAAQIVPSVKEKAEADTTPPQSVPDKKPEDTAQPVGEADKTPPQTTVPSSAEEWAKAKGYGSFAEAKKAFDEKEEALQRSQKFIKEKLEPQGTASEQYAALVARTQQLEQELITLRGGKAPATTEEKVETQENKIAVIRQALNANLQKRKALVTELQADPGISVDPEFLRRRIEADAEKDNLDLQMVEEMDALKKTFESTTQKMQDVTASQQLAQQREEKARLYTQEMDEITDFAMNPKHPEFAFSENKDSRDVEAEYVKWANGVASAVYAGPVNMLRSPNDKVAASQALALIKANDPDAINACRAAGIPIEPPDDVKKYLDICDLLDHRDGRKLNPLTGEYEQQFRMVRDHATGMFRKDPVRMASLEDAYQHRCAVDGTYQERIKQAYVKGGKDLAAAAQKRSAAPVELDNATGASAADVGAVTTPADAMKVLDSINEQEALRRKLAGDSTLYDQFEKALGVLETVKI
jgi:hypothetical protein